MPIERYVARSCRRVDADDSTDDTIDSRESVIDRGAMQGQHIRARAGRKSTRELHCGAKAGLLNVKLLT